MKRNPLPNKTFAKTENKVSVFIWTTNLWCGFWCCVKKFCLNFQPITHPSQSHNNAIRGTTVTLRCWSSHCTMETESVEFAGTSATAKHIVSQFFLCTSFLFVCIYGMHIWRSMQQYVRHLWLFDGHKCVYIVHQPSSAFDAIRFF